MKATRIAVWSAAVFAVMPVAWAAGAKRPQAPVVDRGAMVSFAASQFVMGTGDLPLAPYGQSWFVAEQPAHKVSLSAFALDRHEVTVEEFARFLTYAGGEAHFHRDQPIERVRQGYLPVAGTEKEPIRQVTWDAAEAYCRWAGKRLPTEAEWEFAAAGAEGREFPWGSEGPTCERAVHFTSSSFCEPGPRPVGSRPSGQTPEGVFDLAGNVAEWVADWYGDYRAIEQIDPPGPRSGALRVVRGGSFLENAVTLRTRARWGAPPSHRSEAIGFRCALGESDAPDQALRGALEPAADEGRQPRPAPQVESVPEPEVLASGLAEPASLAAVGKRLFVFERGRGRVLELGALGAIPFAEGLGRQAEIASGGGRLVATDPEKGRVVEIDLATGALENLATGESWPVFPAVDAQAVAWSAGGRVRLLERGAAPRDLGEPLAGVAGLALAPEAVIATAHGEGDSAKAGVFLFPRAGGGATVALATPELATSTQPGRVAYDPISDAVWVTVRYRSGPTNGWLFRYSLSEGEGAWPVVGPAAVDVAPAFDGARVLWASSNTIQGAATEGSGPLHSRVVWSHAGGMAVESGRLVWSDLHNGRVYRR